MDMDAALRKQQKIASAATQVKFEWARRAPRISARPQMLTQLARTACLAERAELSSSTG